MRFLFRRDPAILLDLGYDSMLENSSLTSASGASNHPHKTQTDESDSGCAFIDYAFWYGSHVLSSLSIRNRYS